jgi:hypothetical protein
LSKKIASLRLSRPTLLGLAGLFLLSGLAPNAGAQPAPPVVAAGHYWEHFALGFAGSILAHETAHLLTAYAVGSRPHIGLDRGGPTIFSGIDTQRYPRRQFLFSASGLTTQALIDEAILDIPHTRGGAIERGILAGGIGTTLFYITLGRNASVSDVSFMARTSSLSKTQVSLIFGGLSAVHALRISRNPAYDHFFIRPDEGGIRAGFNY